MKKGNGKDNDFFNLDYEAMNGLCKENQDILKEMIDIEFNYSNLWREYLTAQVERLSKAKDISDVMATESGLATEYTNKFTEANRRYYETVSEAMQGQMKHFRFPVAPENLLGFFQGFENTLNENLKKSRPSQSSSA